MMGFASALSTTRWTLVGIALVTSLSFVLAACSTGSSYPTKGVELVCPSAPGGATDTAGRPVAEYLGKKWGQPINVTNKTGAAGTEGVLDMLRGSPDGYKMLVTGNSQGTTNPAIEKDLPYKWDDPVQIARLVINPMVLTVNADSKFQSAKELLDAVKANPKNFKYGTQSAAGPSTLGTAQVLGGAGIDAAAPTRVVFGGGGPTTTALAGGNVDWAILSMSEVQSLVEAKKLRGLAISGMEQRAKQLPTVPTAKEAGLSWYTWVGYTGVQGPSKLPQEIIDKWANGIKEASQDKDFLAKMDTVGAVASYLGPADYKTYMKGEYDYTVQTVTKLGLRTW